ncbi:TonB C-terminal domain-containing protein [Hyalangium versicolor]|uniref:TonB C-terminal domain-containing protein n=1 Tax=Hyalangium versicolor TaxID=2861190 RepID=UPI001CCD9EC6|nr:TonB C-terminal domain-containing protein [Hyalangium versicolor]
MKPGPSRLRLAPALLASVLLHLAIALWLWLSEPRASERPSPVAERAQPNLVELDFTDVPLASPPPPQAPATHAPSPPRSVIRPARRQKPAEPVAERPSTAEPTPPQPPREERPAAGAGEGDAPRKLVLVPSWPAGVPGAGSPAEPESRGRTLHPGDPSLEPESIAETGERLTARVQDWADDGAASARAGGIGQHPYFDAVRGSMEGALGKTEGGDARDLGIRNPMAGIVKSYTQAAEQYAKTGNPGGTPPPVPQQSEKLAQLFGNEPAANRLRIMAQARETLDALNNRSALLTVTLEVRQARNGELLDAKLTELSGNDRFDAFVLRVVPGALGGMTPPPEMALRGRDFLRTQWQVEGWLYTPPEMMKAVSSLAAGQLSLPLDLIFQPEKVMERSRFEYRARLLKVY